MIKTFGLTHISLNVKDIETAYNFYHKVFGINEYWRDESSIHASTPGAKDVITFVKSAGQTGNSGNILHFGFRLTSPDDINEAAEEIQTSGGRILEKGEFAEGVPYLYAADPDGYIIEIWYE